jgi:hypothetical protein
MKTCWMLTLGAVLAAAPVFAQSGLSAIFTTGGERHAPRDDCPDFVRGGQFPTFDDTVGCWSSASYSMPVDGSWLDIQLKPAFALVYVNGRYVGTAQQFTRPYRALLLGAGPQRVEFRAPGYRPVSFWLRQDRDKLSTATGSLTRQP